MPSILSSQAFQISVISVIFFVFASFQFSVFQFAKSQSQISISNRHKSQVTVSEMSTFSGKGAINSGASKLFQYGTYDK